ncbi:hypothetical protein [Chitinimonas sp.]|uniref:hypothetical protein n=1 Tax=Chitinimonas sp. TaxID=1934313 RepID=UPI0035B10C32
MIGPYETFADARRIAKEVLAGADPYLGCGLICEISKKLGSPPSLALFELLAHEQSGHEHLGITPDDLLVEILAALRALVSDNAGQETASVVPAMSKRIPKDCKGIELGIGSRIRLLSLSGRWLEELPNDEIADVRSMIGELFVVEEIDEYGQPWIHKSWMSPVDGICRGHSIALEPHEAECVTGQSNLPPLKVVLSCANGYRPEIGLVVERLIASGVIYIGVVGKESEKIKDIVDEIAVGDGSAPRFVLTASHPGVTLEDAINFAQSLSGAYSGEVQVITLPCDRLSK